jgi:dTDP-4-dehydrorhamnose reductase
MKKIMILGSGGMLGHMVYHYLSSTKKYKIVDASYPLKANEQSHLIDVANKIEIELFVKKEKPDVLINCIGILIKGSQNDPSNAIYLNAYFPHQLVKILREVGGTLIHISTDCVFSGHKGNYSENDFRDADDVYGRSKALGEIVNDKDLTIRTSIIGSELNSKGEGLFHWFMNQKGIIHGYTQAYWAGVTTLECAKAIDFVIEGNVKGLVHLTNGDKISKYDLLCLLKEIWEKNQITIDPSTVKSVDKSLTKSNSFQYQVPSFRKMLQDQKDWMDARKDLYKMYYQHNC